MKTVALFVASLLLPIDCLAVLQIAPPSCKVWLVDRQPKGVVGGVPLMGPMALLEEAWLAGSVSGIADGVGKDFLRDVDVKAVGVWMDKYCQANPERSTIDGSIDFAKEMMKKKGMMTNK